MITKIENALVDRLKRGMGKLVYDVRSYGGEMDSEQLGLIRLPLVLVSYGGSKFEAKGVTARGVRFKTQDSFVVIVLVRSLRNEQAARQGGVNTAEIGANQLLSAVKYLLIGQTLGGLVEPLRPVRVQTLLNNAKVRNEQLTAYAIEFDVLYSETALEDGRYPEQTADPTNRDYIFNLKQGELSAPYPDFNGVDGKLYDPTNDAEQAFSVDLKDKTHDSNVKSESRGRRKSPVGNPTARLY